jgi:hypothetical protein
MPAICAATGLSFPAVSSASDMAQQRTLPLKRAAYSLAWASEYSLLLRQIGG